MESWVRKLGLGVVFLKLGVGSWVLEFVFGNLFCMCDLDFCCWMRVDFELESGLEVGSGIWVW